MYKRQAEVSYALLDQHVATRLAREGSNLISRDVSVDGTPVNLSTTEFELLVYLVRNRGQVLSREQILRAVWGYDHDPGTNIVDVYIGYLRRKLSIGDRAAPITTIRAVGFRLDAGGA